MVRELSKIGANLMKTQNKISPSLAEGIKGVGKFFIIARFAKGKSWQSKPARILIDLPCF